MFLHVCVCVRALYCWMYRGHCSHHRCPRLGLWRPTPGGCVCGVDDLVSSFWLLWATGPWRSSTLKRGLPATVMCRFLKSSRHLTLNQPLGYFYPPLWAPRAHLLWIAPSWAHCSHTRSCTWRFRARTIKHSYVIPCQRQDCSQMPQPCRSWNKFYWLVQNSTSLSQEVERTV